MRDGTPPPASAYPQIADGTLISVAAYKRAFPPIPHFPLPATNLQSPRLDFGGRFEGDGIADQIPPQMGEPFITLVPRPDSDGLDTGGIALPEIEVPLGTRLVSTRAPRRQASPGRPLAGTAPLFLFRARKRDVAPAQIPVLPCNRVMRTVPTTSKRFVPRPKYS